MKNKSIAFIDRVSSKSSKPRKEFGESARKTVEDFKCDFGSGSHNRDRSNFGIVGQ